MFFTQNRRKRQDLDQYEPVFFSDLNVTEDQMMTCEGNEECLYDLVVTNDTELALTTLQEGMTTNMTVDILGKRNNT